eukprot:m.60050 g.60050  ORF g.60050 m.60050 type:complete len:337 (-) comp17402_c0_seq1:115-1125(-)
MSTTSKNNNTLNLDFLRSGAEFKVAAPSQPEAKPEEMPRSRNQRLEEFANKTLKAFEPSDLDAWDGLPCTRRAAPANHGDGPAVLNLDFLRSGAEFKPVHTVKRRTSTDASKRTTRNTRLEDFACKTLVAAQTRAPKPSTAATDTPVLNVDFLRSGGEFKSSPSTTRAATTAGAPSPRSTHNARLEKFHRKTLDAAQAPPRTTATTTTPVLNVAFLRSGAEFKASPPSTRRSTATTATPAPRSTHNARLEDFYRATLKAMEEKQQVYASLDAWDGMPSAAHSIVNIDFLRSDAFKSTHATSSAPMETDGAPSRSKNARLEDFYRQSMQAHMNTADL